MLLQRLVEYAGTLDVPPPMYGPVPVKYVIELDQNGSFQGVSILDGGRKSNDRGKSLIAPTLTRSSGIKPKLLVDNGEYVLGIGREDSNTERVGRTHSEFLQLLETCIAETDSQEVATILTILRRGAVDTTRIPGGFDPSQNITFRVNGRYPFDDPAIKSFWSRYTGVEPQAGTPLCHLCGEKPAEERMPAKVKRIPGGQAAGTALISANSEAFVSYGLKASHVGPTCRDCAERFTYAINHLLRENDTHLIVGNQVYVFWSKGEDFSPVGMLRDPQPVDMAAKLAAGLPSKMAADIDDPAVLKELLKAAWTGHGGAVEVDVEPFYAAAFSASGGRVVVRDWLETTIPAIQSHLARFFWAGMVAGGQKPLVSIHALAGATVRDFRDLPGHTLKSLLNFALKGTRLPPSLLHQAVRRNQAEQRVIHSRAALIKMYFASNSLYLKEEDDMTQLNPEQREPAYLCGRLLAVLEEVQAAAQGNPNTTIVDRFYGTASTAPGVAFPRLMALSQHHLAKLRRDKPGYHTTLQRKLGEVMAGMPTFPGTLTLQEQGLFALGYYHQRTERFTTKNQHDTEEN